MNAKKNPIGQRMPDGVIVVRVGRGKHTHVWDPEQNFHICHSGLNAGRGGPSGARPVAYQSDAQFVTCYRCQKLATLNLDAGREAWRGP